FRIHAPCPQPKPETYVGIGRARNTVDVHLSWRVAAIKVLQTLSISGTNGTNPSIQRIKACCLARRLRPPALHDRRQKQRPSKKRISKSLFHAMLLTLPANAGR